MTKLVVENEIFNDCIRYGEDFEIDHNVWDLILEIGLRMANTEVECDDYFYFKISDIAKKYPKSSLGELDYLPILDIKKKLIEIEKAILFAYDDLVTKNMPLKYDKELKMLIPEEDTEKIDKVCEIE